MIDKIILLNPQDKTILKEEEIGAKSQNVSYNNAASGLEATNVKGAIDELAGAVNELGESIPDVSGLVTTQELEEGLGEKLSADDLKAEGSSLYGSGTGYGELYDSLTLPTRMFKDINTLRLIKQIRDSRLDVSGYIDGVTYTSKGYGHEPQMVIHNGKAYIIYDYHKNGDQEVWSGAEYDDATMARMSIVTLGDNPTVESTVLVKVGDSYAGTGDDAGKTFYYPAAPHNIVLIDSNTIRILYSHRGNILCKDYNISTGELGEEHQCTFSATYNGVTATNQPLNTSNYGELFYIINSKGEKVTSPSIQLHCQYAKIGEDYYIGVNTHGIGGNGTIFTTTDFKHYTLWAVPALGFSSSNGLNHEMALFPWKNSADNKVRLMCAVRRPDGYGSFRVAALKTGRSFTYGSNVLTENDNGDTHGAVDYYLDLPANMNRPCFFAAIEDAFDFGNAVTRGTIYVTNGAPNQQHGVRSFMNIWADTNSNSFNNSTLFLIAQTLTMTYPSIVFKDGEFYVAYQASTGSQSHVFLSRFKPFAANWNKVITGMNKMLDAFMPE